MEIDDTYYYCANLSHPLCQFNDIWVDKFRFQNNFAFSTLEHSQIALTLINSMFQQIQEQ